MERWKLALRLRSWAEPSWRGHVLAPSVLRISLQWISHNFQKSRELGQDLTMVLTQGLVGMPGPKLRVQSP